MGTEIMRQIQSLVRKYIVLSGLEVRFDQSLVHLERQTSVSMRISCMN